MRRLVCLPMLLAAVVLLLNGSPSADDDATPSGDFNDMVDAKLKGRGGPATVRFPIGRTRRGTLIWCLAEPKALDYRSAKQRILIVGGLDGSTDSIDSALEFLEELDSLGEATRSEGAVACVPIVNPDGWATGRGAENLSGGTVNAGYPPEGTAYNSPTDPEAHFLWRFIGWFAPDHVFELHDRTAPEFQRFLSGNPRIVHVWPKGSLGYALLDEPVCEIAKTSVMRMGVSPVVRKRRDDDQRQKRSFFERLSGLGELNYSMAGGRASRSDGNSPLRQTMLRRMDRTPTVVATQLAEQYGGRLDTVMYQPALALAARLRLGELTGNSTHRNQVGRVVGPYVDGTKPTFGKRVSGSHLAGHLIFAEFARLTPDSRYVDLIKTAATYGFDDQGQSRETMPFHNEMSDAVFMACPILTAAGRYTGDDRYFEMAVRHLKFMTNLCVRDDGIYRHSPLCEAAWGRGNGFPALGLALCLADLDAVSDESSAAAEARDVMLTGLRAHLDALAAHQDVTGMWHQVIDDPGSYREMTATCMISYAIVRGIRAGWLDETKYAPIAKRAWEAVKVRIGEDGTLFDVCTGTGKQKTLWDYRDRTAILGKDERGGAMALMFAVETAAWQSGATVSEP